MKSLILALSLAVASIGFLPMEAEAKRFGGGGSSGMQRSMPSRAPEAPMPARPSQVTPSPSPAGFGAAAPRRSWMGPLAGLAAGLGIGALMSHFGMGGGGFGNLLSILLFGFIAFAVIRFVMRRFAPGAPSMATPNGLQFNGNGNGNGHGNGSANGSPQTPPATWAAPATAIAPPARTLPAGFDAPGFERIAKMIFIRMQAANDAADLNDLRTFTTPEMFASVRLELQDRGAAAQQTDVVQVDAKVMDVATEGDRQIVSVRFQGLIREDLHAPTATFDEIWHLVRPVDASRDWAIAGIQQASTTSA